MSNSSFYWTVVLGGLAKEVQQRGHDGVANPGASKGEDCNSPPTV